MSKPIVKNINPYDATKDLTVEFGYSGNQPYINHVIVYDEQTLDIVYYNEVIDLKFSNVIKANSLQNGKHYSLVIQCFDSDKTPSPISDKSYFWTFSKPTFEIADIKDGDVIKTSSFAATVKYSQVENEPLSDVQFILYDINKTKLTSSSVLSGVDATFSFSGLENQTYYYMRMIGRTEHGMELDTGYLRVFTNYENPKSYARIYAKQDSHGIGLVNYWTNINIIRPTRDDYQLINGCVDLRDDYITYNSKFQIDGDFVIALRHSYTNGEIAIIENGQNKIILSIIEFYNGFRYKLSVDNEYTIYSDLVESFGDNLDFLTVYIRRKNNIYDLIMFYDIEIIMKDYDISLDDEKPNIDKYDVWEDLDINSEITDKDIIVSDNEPTKKDKNYIWIGGNV